MRVASISGPDPSWAQNPVKSSFIGRNANIHLHCSLRNHERPIEVKHRPSLLTEAGCLESMEMSLRAAQLLAYLPKGWVTNLPRWLRTKRVIRSQTFSLKLGKSQANQDRLILTPELDPGLSLLSSCKTSGQCPQAHSWTSSDFLGSGHSPGPLSQCLRCRAWQTSANLCACAQS